MNPVTSYTDQLPKKRRIEPESSPFDSIPNEVILKILSHLPFQDIKTANHLSKRFYEVFKIELQVQMVHISNVENNFNGKTTSITSCKLLYKFFENSWSRTKIKPGVDNAEILNFLPSTFDSLKISDFEINFLNPNCIPSQLKELNIVQYADVTINYLNALLPRCPALEVLKLEAYDESTIDPQKLPSSLQELNIECISILNIKDVLENLPSSIKKLKLWYMKSSFDSKRLPPKLETLLVQQDKKAYFDPGEFFNTLPFSLKKLTIIGFKYFNLDNSKLPKDLKIIFQDEPV